jgi:hypothetical protein
MSRTGERPEASGQPHRNFEASRGQAQPTVESRQRDVDRVSDFVHDF